MSIQLIHEALSRARMRRPQTYLRSEADHSARAIAMRARRQQNRLLGETR